MIHRRAAENAERKSFFRSGDTDLKKRLRLAGSFFNREFYTLPEGLLSFCLVGVSATRQNVAFLGDLCVSNE